MASDDRSYNCVQQEEDEQQHIGFAITKDLMNVAGQVIKSHITSLAPLVLPVSEKLKFVVTFVGSKALGLNIEAYVPNFKLAFEHFCIHAGGRAVVDTMQKNLELQDWDMELSRMTLYRFGNTRLRVQCGMSWLIVKPKEESRKVTELNLAIGIWVWIQV